MESLTVGHYPTDFGADRNWISGDIMSLIYHMILQDQVIKGSCDFEWEAIMVSHQPAKFMSQLHCGSGDIMI